MSHQNWKLSLLKNGVHTSLFVSTTDEMVETDLALDPSASLIRIARQYHRRAQTDAQDHRDLAIGAFMKYAEDKPYDLEFGQVEPVAAVPEREPERSVGGATEPGLVPVWEEAQADDEESFGEEPPA